MNVRNSFILSTAPSALPARKPRLTPRSLYRRTRRCLTGKEQDAETGLYYYGARYLDSKTGRWLSGDPALGEYVPSAPINDEARKRNGSLPGMGGVFNYANLHVYHYAGNNPVKYIDPTGLSDEELDIIQKAANYLKSECDKYIENLINEASISGRATASISFSGYIKGVKVKGSLTGVVEYDFREQEHRLFLEAGLDIGLGTPGQGLIQTGAEVTSGLRASIGRYEEGGISGIGVRSISLAFNATAEFAGIGKSFEARKQIINFDTRTGSPDFTLFRTNTTRTGVIGTRRFGIINVGIGARGNGL
jgi:RHS repeat-associated protein